MDDTQALDGGGGTFWMADLTFTEPGETPVAALGRRNRTVSWVDPVDVTVLPNAAGVQTSGVACAEAEGSDFGFTWQVDLQQDKESVTGKISFHACPGRGRVQYRVQGTIMDPLADTLTLAGTRTVARGPLGAVAPRTQTFLLHFQDGAISGEPEPNLDPLHNLAVELTHVPASPALVDRPLTFTAQVTNGGPDDATNVELTVELNLPARFSGGSAGCSLVGGQILCSLGDLPDGATRTIEITLTPLTAGMFRPEFTVDAAGSDFARANNTAGTDITVQEPTPIEPD